MKNSRIALFVHCYQQYLLLFLLVFLYGCDTQQPEIEKAPEKISILAEFRFLSLPSQRARSVRYDIVIDSTDSSRLEAHLPIKARVYCFRDCNAIIEPDVSYKASLFLESADYAKNPSSFHYQAWLDRQGIIYTGRLFLNTLTILDTDTRTLHGRLITWLHNHLEKHDFGWHYLALLTGFRGPLAAQDIELLVNTGTMHLLVVSGLHLGFIFALIFTITRLLLPWRYIWASIASLGAMLTYAWLAGFALATQRAFIMAAVAVVWFLLGKRINPWYGWCLALFAVLIINQPSLQDAGVWLSFGTVALLLITFSRQNKQLGTIPSLFASQWYIFPGLSLLQAIFFDRFGMTTFIANLIAIPFIGLIVLPALLFSCLLLFITPQLGHQLLDVLDLVFRLFWQSLLWLADLPWSSQLLAGERIGKPIFIVIIACLAILQLLPRHTPGKIWAWLFIPLLIFPISSSHSQQAEVWLLESTNNSHLIYRHNNNALVVSLAQDDAIDLASIRYDIAPTLRYFDFLHIDWTTLAQQAVVEQHELVALLRQKQNVNVLAPCHQANKALKLPIEWHQLTSGCVLEVKGETGSLLFFPELVAADLHILERIVSKAVVLYSSSIDNLLVLEQLSIESQGRTCFVSSQSLQQQRLSFCQLVSIDNAGAVRFQPPSWQAHYPFAPRQFNW